MYRALIVCNSRFPKDPGALPELMGPKADGILIRDALTDPDAGLFDRSEVKLLPEADSPEILDAADEFFGCAEADDVLLLYYSGHGRSLSQELFLCASNTRTNRLESSAVASSTLSRIMTRSFAQVKIVILDCCHSGGFKGGDLAEGLSGKGRFIIAAASAVELAGDAESRGEPSPFTRALVEGLLKKARDNDGDGAVDLDDLFAHVAGTRFEGHEPQRKFHGAGAVPIARRAAQAVQDDLSPSAGPDGFAPPDLLPRPGAIVLPVQQSVPAPDNFDLLETVVPQAALDHARVQAFRDELREDVAATHPPQLTTSEFLARSGLVKEGGPTLAGALLFGENPTAVLPTAMVRCARFRGTDKTNPATSTELHGTLPELIVQARDLVAAAALVGELPTTEAAHTDALYRFPMIAVREIIANALVHRDYARADACVAVHVYDDRIEVISPGTWGGGAHTVRDSQRRLGTLERQSQPRNFRLARVLSWAKLVELVGAGVPRSVADCRTVGAPEPVVRILHEMVTVTVFPLADRTAEPALAPRGGAVTADRGERGSSIDPRRIAEVRCKDAEGGVFAVGTGYRVTNDTVLTAGHLVDKAAVYALRFPIASAEWNTTAEVAVLDKAMDVAVLRFSPTGQSEVVAPVRFGRVTLQPAILEVETVGFPRFKSRFDKESEQRDTAHLHGTTSSLTNARSGTLSIRVGQVPDDDTSGGHPWAGMSGAPVWAEGLLIGVVNATLRAEGPGTLRAARIDRFLASSMPGVLQLLGIPEPLDLPEVPAPALQPVSPYLARIQDVAPQSLRGRDEELAALVEFCGGDPPYAVWRGQPWSGKTALTAWFALHPPPNVDVVAFFVTARLSGQDDSTAFTDALVDQLSLYLGQYRAASSTHTGALDSLRRQLLAAAARQAHQERRRLLLVVDGIDEDRGPPSGMPSIASLLPPNPPPGLCVLVTGRELPLPDDVPPDHPLRHCPEVLLTPSSHALSLARKATAELMALLTASPAQRDILGLISAADGDVPLPVLADLVEVAPYELMRLMSGPLGRLFFFSEAEVPATGRVRFAHSALREQVRRMLGPRLMREYARVHETHVHDPWTDTEPPG